MIVSLFKIMSNNSTQENYNYCQEIVKSMTKTKQYGLQKMMLSKSDKLMMKEYLDVLRKSGIDVDQEEKILV